MKILIITGGISSERKISLISAIAVKKALEETNHEVKLYDLREGLLKLKKLIQSFDVIFPVLHGEEGEGGELQKFLFIQNKPFVGGDWKGFKKGWYKISFKKFCDEINIKTANWKIVKSEKDILRFGFPSVLKSSSGGSSKEVVILNSKKDLGKVKKLLKSKNPIFVEKFLEGAEVTVGVVGNQALPVIEIIPPEDGWFDYKNKYSGQTKELPNAPSLNKKERGEVENTALKIHQKLNLGHYSRIDFIFSNGIFNVLEVNTIPGLTPQSLLPKAAQAAGMDFPMLINKLIELSINSFYLQSKTK